MVEVLMPRLSDSMEEGMIIAWLVPAGGEVAEGQELVEIETDKASMTFEADAAGLVHHVAEEGDSLPVGAPIAQLLDAGEEPIAGESAESSPARSVENDKGAAEGPLSPLGPPPTKSSQPGEGERRRVAASPLARRIARDRGVSLETLRGSGPGGRIVKADVEAAAERQAGPGTATGAAATLVADAGKGEIQVVELSRLQQAVARRMTQSKAEVPHFYLSTDVDMSACVEARSGLKKTAAEGAVLPSFNDLVIKACAIALAEFPQVNGSYVDGRIEHYSRINIGLAVATENSLVVPVIPDVDQLGLREIALRAREMAGKVRDGLITPPELSGGTFTVSNLGMFGVSRFDPVINLPQAGILAVGAIEERPVVRDGSVVPASMMSMTLACDHRILYGADGARFLARIRSVLEQPFNLAMG